MIKKVFITLLVIIFSLGALTFSVKGGKGDPVFYQKELDTRVGGPYEASNSSGRYALTKSIVEDNSLFLREDLARFSSPDVVDFKGKYISIFTPGVSFLGVPFYLLGEKFGIPQLATYYLNIVATVLNILLIAIIVKKLNGNLIAGLLAGFTYTFATNAFTYGLTFTQHPLSVTMVLLSLLVAMGKRTLFKNISFGALFGIGFLIDFPNAFFLVPIGLYILSQHFNKEKIGDKVRINIKIIFIITLLGLIPFAGLFGWYNQETTGSYFKLGQSIGRSEKFSVNLDPHVAAKVPENNDDESDDNSGGLSLPFDSRNQLEGFYILMISNERAWIFYSPVILLGIIGFWFLYKKKENQGFVVVASGVILLDIVLYSMFGDPWGGWAFGPRYLIPAAAVLAIGIGELISRFKKNIIFLVVFFILFSYSVFINTAGVMTTNSIPPKVEALNLPTKIPYTYDYNLQLLNSNTTGSLFYNLYLSDSISAKTLTYYFSAILISAGVVLYLLTFLEKNPVSEQASPGKRFSFKNLPKIRKGDKNV